MSDDNRCTNCDRETCRWPAWRARCDAGERMDEEHVAAMHAVERDCEDHRVDWRERALLVEAALRDRAPDAPAPGLMTREQELARTLRRFVTAIEQRPGDASLLDALAHEARAVLALETDAPAPGMIEAARVVRMLHSLRDEYDRQRPRDGGRRDEFYDGAREGYDHSARIVEEMAGKGGEDGR